MQLPHSKKRRPSPPDVDSGSGPAAVTERSASTTGQAEEERDDPAAIAAAATRRNTPMPAFGDVLKLFRIDARELKRKDDYQVSVRNWSLAWKLPPAFPVRWRDS